MAKGPGVSATFRIIAVQTNMGYYIEKGVGLQGCFCGGERDATCLTYLILKMAFRKCT
jgi:hypothetical protein